MRPSPARVLTASGPRAAEELLLAALEEDQRALRKDLELLRRPLFVIVPSKSLRLALQERLAARESGPALGVEVLTLHRFARVLHERAGVPWPRGEALLPLLARRLAPAHPELATLAESRDGLAALVAALRDLQHAGFTPAHAEPLDECLAELDGHPARPRVAQLLALACELHEMLARNGCHPSGHWAHLAAELLRANPDLPAARAIWIHGFQDAPGTTSELLEALVVRAGAQFVFDTLALALPEGSTGTHYGEALAQRLGIAPPAKRQHFAEAGVELAFFNALGPRAEARAVATAVLARIEAGARPERIAIVARSLPPVAGELAASLDALGVPFSGLAARGSLTPAARAVHALADLVEDPTRVHVVRALRAGWRAPAEGGTTDHELLAACGLLGATRLDALAGLDLERALDGARDLRLPGGRGRARTERDDPSGEEDEDDPEPEETLEVEGAPDNRRLVPRSALEWIQRQARAWKDGLAALPAKAALPTFASRFEELVRAQFPERAETTGAVLRALAEALPPELALTRAEFLELAADGLRAAERPLLGGGQSGVQLLDALEARSRVFDELFLVDLHQGVFPRSVREEPLLPDRVRARLTSVLPDLPVKTAALAEEEALFAGLLASAAHSTLSWTRSDDEGKRRAPSPFLRRVWREREHSELSAAKVPLASFAPVRATDPPRVELARTETEALALLGRRGRAAFGAALPEVLAAHGRAGPLALSLARTRLAVLAELEPERGRPAYPNAYLGSVGKRAHPGDARGDAPWVSALEALADCPWQMLLGRALGLAPAVPVRDVGAVLEPAHVGSVVHGVLARIVNELGAQWPDEAGLRELCGQESRTIVRTEHIAPAGLARLLALRALGFLEVARRMDALREGSVRAEVEGELPLDSGRRLRFRADRIEHPLEGGAAWIDFKTSRKPLSNAVKLEKREEHMRKAVGEAKALQAAAYALAAGPDALGRYVYLHPLVDDERRAQDASGADPEIRRLFLEATGRLYAALEEGAFPPRLVAANLGQEHAGCKRCDYRSACQVGDSGMRARTVEWLRGDRHAAAQSGFAGALQGVWRLKRPAQGGTA